MPVRERMRGAGRPRSGVGLLRDLYLAAGVLAAAALPSQAQEQLNVTLSPNPPNITLLAVGIAQKENLFEKFGVKVTVDYLANGITAYRGLEGGQTDVTAVNSLVNIIAVAKGSTVKQFYAILQNQQHIVVSNGAASCSDVKGKAVAIDEVGGQIEMMARRFLATCGLGPADVQYATLGPAGTPAGLMSKQVVLGFLPPERVAEMRQRMPSENFRALATMRDVFPNLQGTSWAATTAVLKNKREAIVRFTAAMIAANKFILDPANKSRVVETMVAFNKVSKETAEAAYPIYLEMKIWPQGLGISRERMAAGNAEAIEGKAITSDQSPSYESVVDAEIYEKAEKL